MPCQVLHTHVAFSPFIVSWFQIRRPLPLLPEKNPLMIWPAWCLTSRPKKQRKRGRLEMSLSTALCLLEMLNAWSILLLIFISLTKRAMPLFLRWPIPMCAWYRSVHTSVSIPFFEPWHCNDAQSSHNHLSSLSDWLSVSQGSKPLIAQLVEPSMNPVFNKEHKAFIWNYYEGTHVYSWLLQFPSKESIETFKEMFGRCIFEALNQTPFSKFEVSLWYYMGGHMPMYKWELTETSLSLSRSLFHPRSHTCSERRSRLCHQCIRGRKWNGRRRSFRWRFVQHMLQMMNQLTFH